MVGDHCALDYGDCFNAAAGVDPHRAADAELRELAAAAAGEPGACWRDQPRGTCLDLVFSLVVQPRLPAGAVFVTDYPACQAKALSHVEWDGFPARQQAARVDVLMSVCTGAAKLAAAELLDGKEAATHHDYVESLGRRFPSVRFVGGRRFVQSDPKIITAGGLTSGIDAALHVVEPWKFVLPGWEGVVERFAVRPEYDVLEVQFPGQQPLKASVVAVSAEHDLAILQVQQTGASAVPLGQTNAEVKVTDEIAVLGYPGNLGQYQVQVQNVTGFGEATREITEVTPSFIQGTVAQPLTASGEGSHHLVFTAAIEPGNSGGPVVNRQGQVIGIVSFQFDRTGPPITILGEEIPTQLPAQAGSRAVSPDDIQSFLRQHGFA